MINKLKNKLTKDIERAMEKYRWGNVLTWTFIILIAFCVWLFIIEVILWI